METIYKAVQGAIEMILSGDPQILEITALSLQVSLTALVVSALIGIPLGALLGLKRFPGKNLVMNLAYTLMALPPVLAGLIIYLTVSNAGPLGMLQLLYTPTAMIAAQILLGTPIVCGLTARAVMSQQQEVYDTALTLGASNAQAILAIILESRLGIISALTAAFGRQIAEVGAVMMVGGNIKGSTRVLTTSIVLETRIGNDAEALAFGFVLLVLAFIIIMLMLLLEKRTFKDEQGIQIN